MGNEKTIQALEVCSLNVTGKRTAGHCSTGTLGKSEIIVISRTSGGHSTPAVSPRWSKVSSGLDIHEFSFSGLLS